MYILLLYTYKYNYRHQTLSEGKRKIINNLHEGSIIHICRNSLCKFECYYDMINYHT